MVNYAILIVEAKSAFINALFFLHLHSNYDRSFALKGEG